MTMVVLFRGTACSYEDRAHSSHLPVRPYVRPHLACSGSRFPIRRRGVFAGESEIDRGVHGASDAGKSVCKRGGGSTVDGKGDRTFSWYAIFDLFFVIQFIYYDKLSKSWVRGWYTSAI